MKCGVGDYTERLAQSLYDYTDLDVSVLTSSIEGPMPPSVGPDLYPIMATWGRWGLGDFWSAMRRIQPDILHIQFPTQGYRRVDGLCWIPWISRVFGRTPVVFTWHEYVPSDQSNILRCMYLMAMAASALIVVRPNYAQKIPRLMRFFLGRTPVRFIPNVSNLPSILIRPEERQAMRERLGCGESKIIAHFGFVFAHKGTDLMFKIADPMRHHLLIIGELSATDPYHARLLELAAAPEWKGKVTITGFIEAKEAARLLALADAVVYPHVNGGGVWNTSLHAAACQGTFVLTTSTERSGYDHVSNIYYAPTQAVDEMRQALVRYAGIRSVNRVDAAESWRSLATAHVTLYRSVWGVK
jgi:glycosyltransferase involved in cell wall biosynthesis